MPQHIFRVNGIIKHPLDIDAFHIACAEHGKVEGFLTTDDLLLKKCQQNQEGIQVKVANPLTWLMEVL